MLRSFARGLGLALPLLVAISLPVLGQATPSPTPEAAAPSMSPSQATAAALAALLPETIEGMATGGTTLTAGEILAAEESDALVLELAALAEANAAQINRFAIASRGGADDDSFTTFIVGSIPGVPAEELRPAFVRLLVGATDPELTSEQTIEDRLVTVVRATPDAGAEDTLYVVSVGDVVWVVIADDDSLAEALGAIPAAS